MYLFLFIYTERQTDRRRERLRGLKWKQSACCLHVASHSYSCDYVQLVAVLANSLSPLSRRDVQYV